MLLCTICHLLSHCKLQQTLEVCEGLTSAQEVASAGIPVRWQLCSARGQFNMADASVAVAVPASIPLGIPPVKAEAAEDQR